MESRQITEYKVYRLILNPMRGNTEDAITVAISYEKQKLINWYNSQLATEVYVKEGLPSFEVHGDSHRWHKTFREGSDLEWYNPCYDNFEPDRYHHGISSLWAQEQHILNSGVLLV